MPNQYSKSNHAVGSQSVFHYLLPESTVFANRAGMPRTLDLWTIMLTACVLVAFAPVASVASDAKDDGKPVTAPAATVPPTVPPAPAAPPVAPGGGVPADQPGVAPLPPGTMPQRQPRPRVVPPPTAGGAPTRIPTPGVPQPPGTPVPRTSVPAAIPVPGQPPPSGVPVAPGVLPGQPVPTSTSTTPRPRVVSPGVPARTLTLKIDKQLMGKVDVTTLKAMRSGDFTPGQRFVVGLVKTGTGWAVSSSSPWFEGKDEAQIAEAIKEFPLQVTLMAPAPEVPVDTDLEWKVKVKNTGKKDLIVNFQSIDLSITTDGLATTGYPRSGGMGFSAASQKTITAGGEAMLSSTEKLYGPANWKLFGPQAWPLDYKARAIVRFSEVDASPPPNPSLPPPPAPPSFTAKSEWIVGKAVAPPAK